MGRQAKGVSLKEEAPGEKGEPGNRSGTQSAHHRRERWVTQEAVRGIAPLSAGMAGDFSLELRRFRGSSWAS
jgi:hypothetical protein